MTDELNL